MGMANAVTLDSDALLSWSRLQELLHRSGFPVQLRMIDGQLSFPEETPPDAWRELRLSSPHGMVTLRRDRNQIEVITWGNADPAMVQTWNALIWAVAEVGGGRIAAPDGPKTPEEFRRAADLPAALRGGS